MRLAFTKRKITRLFQNRLSVEQCIADAPWNIKVHLVGRNGSYGEFMLIMERKYQKAELDWGSDVGTRENISIEVAAATIANRNVTFDYQHKWYQHYFQACNIWLNRCLFLIVWFRYCKCSAFHYDRVLFDMIVAIQLVWELCEVRIQTISTWQHATHSIAKLLVRNKSWLSAVIAMHFQYDNIVIKIRTYVQCKLSNFPPTTCGHYDSKSIFCL